MTRRGARERDSLNQVENAQNVSSALTWSERPVCSAMTNFIWVKSSSVVPYDSRPSGIKIERHGSHWDLDRSTIFFKSFSLPASTVYRNMVESGLRPRGSATPGTWMNFLTAEVSRLPASASLSNAASLAVVSRSSDLTALPPDAAPAEAAGIDSAVLLDPWSGEVPWRFSLSDVSGRAIASPRDPNQGNSSFGWHGDNLSG